MNGFASTANEISDDDFALLHDVVERTAERLVEEGELPWHPSFFEMLTAIAFEYFAQNKVEIAVLEVGMGGRLDATNVIEPRVSVITDISLDHQKFLGNTVAEIAREKAGIIRPGGVVVTLPQQPQANDVIGNTILELGAQGVSAVPYVPPVSPASAQYFVRSSGEKPFNRRGRGGVTWRTLRKAAVESRRSISSRYPLQVMGKQILVETPLVGRHQLRNIALAIAAAEVLSHQGFADHPANHRTRHSRNPLARAFPGCAREAATRPNMSSMWRTTRRERGRCAPLCPPATRTGR